MTTPTPTKVGVLGARGRMGSEAVRAVSEAPDLELAAAINREDGLDPLVRSGVQVAVELTHPDSVLEHVRFCVDNGVHAGYAPVCWGPAYLPAGAKPAVEAVVRV